MLSIIVIITYDHKYTHDIHTHRPLVTEITVKILVVAVASSLTSMIRGMLYVLAGERIVRELRKQASCRLCRPIESYIYIIYTIYEMRDVVHIYCIRCHIYIIHTDTR